MDENTTDTPAIAPKRSLKRPLTITVANNKGGAGKSTITRYLSFNVALRGYKTLIIDEDPSANTTKSMIITKARHDEEPYTMGKTMMAGVRDGSLTDLVVPIIPNLYLIPSHIDFASLPVYLSKQYGVAEPGDPDYQDVEGHKVAVIKNLLEPLKKDFDFIFIDTPPTTSSDFTRSAVFASDYVIIAFQTQADSFDGAIQFIDGDLSELVHVFKANTDVLGVLPNQFAPGGTIDETVLNDARQRFGKQNLFEHILPYKKRVQSAPRIGITREGYWNSDLFKTAIDPLTDDFFHRLDLVGELNDWEW